MKDGKYNLIVQDLFCKSANYSSDKKEPAFMETQNSSSCYTTITLHQLNQVQSSTFFLILCSLLNYKTIILLVVLYGCETWSLTLREEHRLRVFENRVLRRIFGLKRDEVYRRLVKTT
jgi:hypothetical protein